MSAPTIIACPKCAQKLGIPRDQGTIHVKCPKCAEEWDWPAQASSGPQARPSSEDARAHRDTSHDAKEMSGSGSSVSHSFASRWQAMVWLMFLGIVAIVAYYVLIRPHPTIYIPPAPLPARGESAAGMEQPVWNPPPEETPPDNGDGVFRFDRLTANSKLRIIPRGEQRNVVVKV